MTKRPHFVGPLYHATRASSLAGIMGRGLLRERCGVVSGGTEYTPAGGAVYLSRKPQSDNLSTALFAEPVVVIRVDASLLNPDLLHPDDFLAGVILDEYLDEETAAGRWAAAASFGERFGIDQTRARRILTACERARTDTEIVEILQEVWPGYLEAEGEVAYAGDVPPEAILGWDPWLDGEPDGAPRM